MCLHAAPCGPQKASFHIVCLCLHFNPRLYSSWHCFVFCSKMCVCVCVFAWQVIRNVEVKCSTYLAISHVINSYMIFFSFIFSYWGVNTLEIKVAWNWSDARIFNVPLRTYHFLTGKIWGVFQPCLWTPIPQLQIMIKLFWTQVLSVD